MAIPSANAWEMREDGSDTLNGGGFDPSCTGMATDLTATSANTASPVVSSASYSFVAGDVGHYLFVKAGTNWYAGWYPIVSVSGGAATLDASQSAVVRYQVAGSGFGIFAHTAAGCASVASPTGGTWTIDYSQASTRPFALTGVTTSAANAILLTSSATKAMAGNGAVITGGTNFTTGYYSITAVSAGVSLTLDRTCTTAAGSGGAVGIGGALASIGQVVALAASNNTAFVRAGTYLITSASANVPGGCVSTAQATNGNNFAAKGYATNRLDLGTRPIIRASGISSFTMFSVSADTNLWINLEFDGNNLSSGRGFNCSGNGRVNVIRDCVFRNFTNSALVGAGNNALNAYNCYITGCSTAAAVLSTSFSTFYCCVAKSNTGVGFAIANSRAFRCVSANNAGASSDGFTCNGNNYAHFIECVAYGNGRHGFYIESGSAQIVNTVAVSNGGYGVYVTPYKPSILESIATFSNTSGAGPVTSAPIQNFITLTAGPFIDAANGDFRLNDTPGGGALLRALGYPSAFPGLPLTTNFADIGAVQASPSRSGWGL